MLIAIAAGIWAAPAKGEALQKYVKDLYLFGYPDSSKLEALISSGEDVNFVDGEGKTPLWNLINRVLPQQILGGLATFSRTPNIKEDEFVKKSATTLIKWGADVNLTDKATKTSVMELALKAGYIDLASSIVDAGLNVNMIDNSDYNALLAAALYDYTGEVLEKILAKGTDINYSGKKVKNMNSLQMSAWAGNFNNVRILVENNADINAVNQEKKSALNFAFGCLGGSDAAYEIAEYLLAKGAAIEQVGENSIQGLQRTAFAANNFGNYMMLSDDGLKSINNLLSFLQYSSTKKSEIDNSTVRPDDKTMNWLLISFLNATYKPAKIGSAAIYGYRIKSMEVAKWGEHGAVRLNVKAYALISNTKEGTQQIKTKEGKLVDIPYYYRLYKLVPVEDTTFDFRCLKNDFGEWYSAAM
jgi:ankyrin repeat protein